MNHDKDRVVVQEQGKVLEDLMAYFRQEEKNAVSRLAQDILGRSGQTERLPDYKILVAYGGGKDSSYTLAFMRAVQLHLQSWQGTTFRLRVANMRHAGVPFAVMANIDRVYQALELYDDPRVELLTVDHDMIRPFRLDLPFPEHVRRMNRFDVLMNGHRTAGDGRPTFCNSCNLAVADFYGRAAWANGGVDAVMTGDSLKEQKHYFTWIMRLASVAGMDVNAYRNSGFKGLLHALDGVGQAYYEEVFGAGFETEKLQRRISCGDALSDPEFISIYGLISYRVDEHWPLLTSFLGFRFDELAFSFTESDCASPVLMAHFRGLKAQFVQGRNYRQGIEDYLVLAKALMRKKEMPGQLIELALSAYATPEKIGYRRELASRYANEAFDLTEGQLICMQFAPFVDQGRALSNFLTRCHPERMPVLGPLHALLKGEVREPELQSWIEGISGLPLNALQNLYDSTLAVFPQQNTLTTKVLANDPHKLRIKTIHPVSGEPVVEWMSGR